MLGGGTTASSKQCNGIPITNWSCCSTSNQCDAGEGDCDLDSHCKASLTCGNDNCRKHFSSSGANWDRTADCCEGILIIVEGVVTFVEEHQN